jgi:DNA-binding winged helix-turn-helix (wHTH) protein/TolB-like protein
MDAQNIGSTSRRLRFGVFEFDARNLELWKNGRPVPIRPQPLKLLALLLDHPGAVVSREDMQRALWSKGTFVDFEQGVNHAVRELRTALSDVAESPRFIQTLPRRGYRFLPPVEALTTPEPSVVATPPAMPLPNGSETRSSGPAIDGVPARPARQSWRGLLAASALGAVVTAMVGMSPALRVGDESSATRRLVLSVEPFETPPGDPITGVGLARAISTRLGGQQALPVVATVPGGSSAALAPPDRAPALPDATHVLTGRLRRSGADVSVVTELGRGDGSVLWSGSLRVRADQLFDIESVIAERVVDTLRVRLAATEQERLRRRYTRDEEAYRAYLRGREALVAYTPAGAQDAVRAFEAALSRDPEYALARAGLAMAAADMYLRFAPSNDVEQWGPGRSPRLVPRWRSTPISPRPIWPGPPWPASGSSTGTRRSRPVSGRSCSIRTWRRRTCSRPPPTTTWGTWRRRGSRSTRARACTGPT